MAEIPTFITQLQAFLSLSTLEPTPIYPHDPLAGLMAYREGKTKYLYWEDQLVGLNLAHSGLTDEQWSQLVAEHGETLQDLQALNLSGNKLNHLQIPATWTALRWLNASNNEHLTQVDLPPYLPELRQLFLDRCGLIELVLHDFPQLTKLDLNRNNLQDLTGLQKCPALQHIHLNDNTLTYFELPGSLTELTYLDLRKNAIEGMRCAKIMRSLEWLDLRSNHLPDFEEALLDQFPGLDVLLLDDNPEMPDTIKGFLEAQSHRSAISFLRETYYPDLRKGKAKDREAKVLLIGNGGVGKTVLANCLMGKPFDPEWKSTHAISVKRFEQEDYPYVLNLWDFGGQDIYHATHRLFMQSNTVYLALWDQETEAKDYSYLKEKGRDRPYRNYLLPYWLHYAHDLGKDSPIIVVQTKVGMQGEHRTRPGQDIEDSFKPIAYAHVESKSQNWSQNGYYDLLDDIKKAVRRVKPMAAIPANWIALRKDLQERIQADEKYLPYQAYLALAGHHEVSAPLGILENWLVKTGVVFYRQGLFGGLIILDQEWAIQAVYALMDRNGAYYDLRERDEGGIFTGADLQQIWAEYEVSPGQFRPYTDGERELFVSFMLSCDLCFEDTPKEQRNRLPFPERRYVAPQLLPNKKPRLVAKYWENRPALYFRYTHPFLHYGVIQRFIVQTQALAELDDIWHNGTMISQDGQTAVVEAIRQNEQDAPINVIQVTVTQPGLKLLAKIRKLLEDPDQRNQQLAKDIQLSVSMDGEHYVSLTELEGHDPEESPTIRTLCGSRKYFDYEPLKVFLERVETGPDEEPLGQSALKTAHNIPEIMIKQENPKPKRGFISYAHGDDRRLITAFIERLNQHTDWESFDDRQIELGERWRDRLRKELQACDFGILLLSGPFMNSDFIRDQEVATMLARGIPIFPVMLRPCNLDLWPQLQELQFFTALGEAYGLEANKRGKQIAFFNLTVMGTNSELNFQPSADDFILNFIAKVNQALNT
ncbi:MAG: COR domain-containing protein [Bacteroidota bacterium]